MDAVKFVLLFAVVFALALQHGECMCQRRHPQEHFCNAHFAVLAGIKDLQTINEGSITMEMHYTVRIRKSFKFTEEYLNATRNASQVVIISPAAGNLAVPTMKIGASYLVTGVIVNDQMYTSYCDWVEPYNKLTDTQKNGLRKKYASGCECQYTVCRGEMCGNQANSNTCEWESGSVVEQCIRDFGICESKKKGCKWVDTKLLNNCKRKAEKEYGFGDLLAPDEEFPPIY